MSNTWFSSDQHWGHNNVIRFDNETGQKLFGKDLRPYSSVEEMDEDMILKWNSVVNPGDAVYHLGDIFFKKDQQEAIAILKRLNGNISICFGNHDKIARSISYKFYWSGEVKEISVKGQKIFLSHYAHKVWNGSHRGNWHLHGHSHLSLTDDPYSLSFDVGCMGNDMLPYSFEQVRRKMSTKKKV